MKLADIAKQSHASFYDLVQARLSKILKLATSPPTHTSLQEIPVEEQLFLTRISKLISEWTTFFLYADKSE